MVYGDGLTSLTAKNIKMKTPPYQGGVFIFLTFSLHEPPHY